MTTRAAAESGTGVSHVVWIISDMGETPMPPRTPPDMGETPMPPRSTDDLEVRTGACGMKILCGLIRGWRFSPSVKQSSCPL
jgi:hypothetical protein